MSETQHEVSERTRLVIEAFFKGCGGLKGYRPSCPTGDMAEGWLKYKIAMDDTVGQAVEDINDGWPEPWHVSEADVDAVARKLVDAEDPDEN